MAKIALLQPYCFYFGMDFPKQNFDLAFPKMSYTWASFPIPLILGLLIWFKTYYGILLPSIGILALNLSLAESYIS